MIHFIIVIVYLLLCESNAKRLTKIFRNNVYTSCKTKYSSLQEQNIDMRL